MPASDPRGNRRNRRGGLPQRHLLLRQPRGHARRRGPGELRSRSQADREATPRRRRSRSAWSCSTARSTTRTTCATDTPWGVEAVQAGRLAARSSCCTTSTTCRSWKATSSARSRTNTHYIGHYHTGGVPGRNEIDERRRLNYRAIMRAIVETGFKGYVGQEFTPNRDPLTSLAEAGRICDV